MYERPRVDVGWWKGGVLRVGSQWLRWILVGDVDDWFPDVGGVRVAVISWRYGCGGGCGCDGYDYRESYGGYWLLLLGGGCVVASCDPELRMET